VGLCLITESRYYLHFAALGFFVIIFVFYYARRKKQVEGDRLRMIFGEEWDRYDNAVPDYFPRLVPYSTKSGSWSLKNVFNNSEHWTALGVIFLALAISFKNHIIAP
jgi:hypothetical protein